MIMRPRACDAMDFYNITHVQRPPTPSENNLSVTHVRRLPKSIEKEDSKNIILCKWISMRLRMHACMCKRASRDNTINMRTVSVSDRSGCMRAHAISVLREST